MNEYTETASNGYIISFGDTMFYVYGREKPGLLTCAIIEHLLGCKILDAYESQDLEMIEDYDINPKDDIYKHISRK